MNAPFHIGQKVVALRTCARIIKGNIYHISDVVQCQKCGHWTVDIKEHERVKDNIGCWCHGCISVGDTCIYTHQQFAPIETNYCDATAEILEKFKQTDEQPDKILKPQTA